MPLFGSGSGGLFGAAESISDTLGDTPNGGNGRKKTLSVSSFDNYDSANPVVSITPDSTERAMVLERRIKWGNQERWGFGSAERARTIGTAFVDLVNSAGNSVEGELHLEKTDANKRNDEIHWSETTDDLRVGETSKEDREAIPERVDKNKAQPEEYLRVTVQTDASDVDLDASTVVLPITVYD